MPETEIECESLIKRHGKAFTLGPVSLTIGPGVTCVVGANGAGKSTFFRLMAGVDRPSEGSIAVLTRNGAASVGYLPQDPDLPSSATCEQFLHYIAWLFRVPSKRRDASVKNALALTNLSEKRMSKIRNLSGGMARRLGISHALVHDPSLLLLDEPTSGLDPLQRIALRDTITNAARDRVVVVATHLVEDVRAIADRVVILSAGSLVFDGDIATLERRANPDSPGETDLERAVATLMGDAT